MRLRSTEKCRTKAETGGSPERDFPARAQQTSVSLASLFWARRFGPWHRSRDVVPVGLSIRSGYLLGAWAVRHGRPGFGAGRLARGVQRLLGARPDARRSLRSGTAAGR